MIRFAFEAETLRSAQLNYETLMDYDLQSRVSLCKEAALHVGALTVNGPVMLMAYQVGGVSHDSTMVAIKLLDPPRLPGSELPWLLATQSFDSDEVLPPEGPYVVNDVIQCVEILVGRANELLEIHDELGIFERLGVVDTTD